MTRPLGLNPHGKTPHELVTIRWAGAPIRYRASVDNMTGVVAGLDDNDRYGDCGPTSVDNHQRITTRTETGAQLTPSIANVLALYSASTSPPFNPATGANDNGVQMPDLLSALRKVGLGGNKIVGFGRLADTSDASIYTAIDLFGAVLFAVDLQDAQKAQSDAASPVWQYVPGSGEWGGHAIVAGAYDSTSGRVDVFSWAMRIGTTSLFRQHRLSEVWVPLWPSVVASDKFNTTVDVAYLAEQFTALTGTAWPAPAPTPTPAPSPSDPLATFAAEAAPWAAERHSGSNGVMATATKKYLLSVAAEHPEVLVRHHARHGFVYIDARTGRFASAADNAADPDHIIRLSIGGHA